MLQWVLNILQESRITVNTRQTVTKCRSAERRLAEWRSTNLTPGLSFLLFLYVPFMEWSSYMTTDPSRLTSMTAWTRERDWKREETVNVRQLKGNNWNLVERMKEYQLVVIIPALQRFISFNLWPWAGGKTCADTSSDAKRYCSMFWKETFLFGMFRLRYFSILCNVDEYKRMDQYASLGPLYNVYNKIKISKVNLGWAYSFITTI